MLAEKGKSEKLTCPLCSGVFRDPHIATCGVSQYATCIKNIFVKMYSNSYM